LVEPISILIPGGLRLRTAQPLLDRDGSCPLLYDCERSRLVDVPSEFQFHIAVALETGDLDEDLLGWLGREDVLTWERQPDHLELDTEPWSEAAELERTDDGDDAFGQVYFAGDRVHCRIGLGCEDAAVATLEAVLRRVQGAAMVALRLTSERPLAELGVLERLVAAAARCGRPSGREICYELAIDPTGVDPAAARLLAEHPFGGRVPLDGPVDRLPPAALRGLDRLLQAIPERLTVQASLGPDQPLTAVWRWASRLRIRHLDAVPEATVPGDGAQARYKAELLEVSDATFAELETGRLPTLYEPLARVLRKLAAGRPVSALGAAEAGCLGLISHGEVLPLPGGLGVLGGFAGEPPAAVPSDDLDEDLDDWAAGDGFEALGATGDRCWSRMLCDCATAEDDSPPAPAAGRCEVRRTEVEVAILLFRRLRDADLVEPITSSSDEPWPALDGLQRAPRVELKTC
jgi:hypothetical protein